MTDGAKEIQAIPTVYRGVQMRSRAEADMARLLHLLKLPWQYEATSVLLPNGMHYRPDFVVPSRFPATPPTWIEVRGYATTDSVRQIQEAALAVASGTLACQQFYVVSGAVFTGPLNAACFYGSRDSLFTSGCALYWDLAFCPICHTSRFMIPGVSWNAQCNQCGEYEGPTARVGFADGYVALHPSFDDENRQPIRLRDIADDVDFVELLSPGVRWIR